MLNYGIHEGNLMYPENGLLWGLPQSIIEKVVAKVKDPRKYASPPDPKHNYYKVLAEAQPFYLYLGNDASSQLIDSVYWFGWYLQFYEKLRTEHDDKMIQWWAQVVDWALNKNIRRTATTDQMLLEYAWNPGFEWKTNMKLYL